MCSATCTRRSRSGAYGGLSGVAADSREILEEGGVAADVLDKLISSTLAHISSDGPGEDTLLDRLMQRELELLNSIWDGRREPPFILILHASLSAGHQRNTKRTMSMLSLLELEGMLQQRTVCCTQRPGRMSAVGALHLLIHGCQSQVRLSCTCHAV